MQKGESIFDVFSYFYLSGQNLANQPATVHTRNRWQQAEKTEKTENEQRKME